MRLCYAENMNNRYKIFVVLLSCLLLTACGETPADTEASAATPPAASDGTTPAANSVPATDSASPSTAGIQLIGKRDFDLRLPVGWRELSVREVSPDATHYNVVAVFRAVAIEQGSYPSLTVTAEPVVSLATSADFAAGVLQNAADTLPSFQLQTTTPLADGTIYEFLAQGADDLPLQRFWQLARVARPQTGVTVTAVASADASDAVRGQIMGILQSVK